MGACGSKSSTLVDDGPPMFPGIKPIEMVTTGSTLDDLVESNILEPDEIDDIFTGEVEPNEKDQQQHHRHQQQQHEQQQQQQQKQQQQQQQQQDIGSQKGFDNPTSSLRQLGFDNPTSSLRQLPSSSNPSKNIVETPTKTPLPIDKNLKAFDNPTPLSSSTKLGEGLSKLEVLVQSPRNTKKVSPQEFFSDDLKSMDFDLFDSPSSHGQATISMGSIEEIALKSSDDAPTNKLQRSRASIQTNSTSSYEEIVIESDDDFEVESTVFEVASGGSYVEEVIDDKVYEAFVKAQQESHGALTFDDFIHLQQGEETANPTTGSTDSPAVVEPPTVSRGVVEPPALSKGVVELPAVSIGVVEPAVVAIGVAEPPALAIVEDRIDDPQQVEIETTKADQASIQVTTDDQSAIVTEQTLQTELEIIKPLSETTSLRPLSFLVDPKTPLSNKSKPNGIFVGMDLFVSRMLEESTDDADRFLVSPLASPPQYTTKATAIDVPFSPLSQKGLGYKAKVTTRKGPKIADKKKKSKSHSPDDNNKIEGENDKKSPRRISRQSKSGDDTDTSKEHRKHHRRKESSKSLLTESISESKRKESSRSLDKATKKKKTTSSSKKNDDGTTSKRSSTSSSKKRVRDQKHIGDEQGKDEGAAKKSASPRSKPSTKNNPIVLTNEKGAEIEAIGAESKAQNRRPSRKIKFQPRASNREDETMLVDHKSLESDRSSFVQKMDALRARLDEVVGSSSSDLLVPSMAIPDTQESNEGDEKARGRHKISRKKNQDEQENLKGDTPTDGAKKVKPKRSSTGSSPKRTSGSGQNAKTSSCRPTTTRGKS